MEELLHYVWKHKLFPLAPLTTTDGKSVEVVDVGLHNRHAGPDFFNAKVRIDGTLWVGNVEIHDKASDWFVHGHDRDARYDNVVLHVVDIADVVVRTSQGATPPADGAPRARPRQRPLSGIACCRGLSALPCRHLLAPATDGLLLA